jgi:pimeloyl-ACP methyl ester carboxylesterase
VEINVSHWGSGRPVVLVHGAVNNGEASWSKQRPLADRWRLIVPDRRGFFPNPPADGSDFEIDAGDVAELLGDSAHLVGHSYGAIVALLAAARRPEAVRSLTVIEPPAFSLLRGRPDIEQSIAEGVERFRTGATDPRAFFLSFLESIGAPTRNVPDPLPPPVAQNVALFAHERPPWEAELPVDQLRNAPFPKLVVSGGHNTNLELLSDTVAAALGSDTQRAVITGAGHSVARTGAAFNDRLESLLDEGEVASSAR